MPDEVVGPSAFCALQGLVDSFVSRQKWEAPEAVCLVPVFEALASAGADLNVFEALGINVKSCRRGLVDPSQRYDAMYRITKLAEEFARYVPRVTPSAELTLMASRTPALHALPDVPNFIAILIRIGMDTCTDAELKCDIIHAIEVLCNAYCVEDKNRRGTVVCTYPWGFRSIFLLA